MRNFDMLVKLYDLPAVHAPDVKMVNARISILRPMPCDRTRIAAFIRETFSEVWANEFEKAMSNTPVSCFIAVDEKKRIVGFSCYDASCRNFFGPIGVTEECRGLHVGKELLLSALYAMREAGYGYAIIGWCEEKNRQFYRKACGAVEIPDSFPGVYRDSLSAETEKKEKEASL